MFPVFPKASWWMVALGLACLCGWAGSRAAEASPMSPSPGPLFAGKPVTRLKVVIRTTDEWGGGTDDPVWFSLGPAYEWPLVPQGGERVFRPGNADVFVLPPQGLKVEDIRWIRVRKGRGASDSRWLFRGIEVWVNGRPLYCKGDINTCLEEGRLEWTAPDYPPARYRQAPH